MIKMEPIVPASEGGCWYCEKKDGNLVFSIEFDTYVHLNCIREALRKDPTDAEAQIMAREFGIVGGSGHEGF